MAAIVRNEARRILRHRGPFSTDINLEEDLETAATLPSSLLRIDVETALYRLPWDEARAVALFYLKGQSIREIGRFLGRPEGTIKRWLHTGRRLLARELEAYAPVTPSIKRRLRQALLESPGDHPVRLAVDPNNNRVYALNRSGSVTVVDALKRQVTAHIDGIGKALAIAVNAESNRLYVAHSPLHKTMFCGQVTVIDGTSLRPLANVNVGNSPRALAVNPQTGKVYVTSSGENAVFIVGGTDHSVLGNVSVGSVPFSLAVNVTSNRIYVANWGSWTLSVIDGDTDAVAKVIQLGAFPTDMALDPRTNRIYVANNQDDSVSVIDVINDILLETIPVGRCPVGIAVSPSRDEIYVTHSASDGGMLYVINTITRQKTEELPIGGGLGNVVVNPCSESVLVAEEAMGIRVIEAA